MSKGKFLVEAYKSYDTSKIYSYNDAVDIILKNKRNNINETIEICLNLGTLNSAKERINTKNAISSVAISANVAIQAGAPGGGHLGHSCSSSSSTSSVASAINFVHN